MRNREKLEMKYNMRHFLVYSYLGGLSCVSWLQIMFLELDEHKLNSNVVFSQAELMPILETPMVSPSSSWQDLLISQNLTNMAKDKMINSLI